MWSTYLNSLDPKHGQAVGHSTASGRQSVSRIDALSPSLVSYCHKTRTSFLSIHSRWICTCRPFYSCLYNSPSAPDSQSRRASVISNANSAYSAATSTRQTLSNNMHSQLEPPTPFTSNPFAPSLSRTESPLLGDPSLSLSVNYLPTKFSDAVLYNGLKNRDRGFQPGPKRGGGREAFRSGEARMPGDGDEDYDGLQGGIFGKKEGGRTRPRLRWNRFKWTLFFSNLLVSPVLLLDHTFSPSHLPLHQHQVGTSLSHFESC
jgi:hypothetical protein